MGYMMSMYLRLLLFIFLKEQATGTTEPATSKETQTVDLEPSTSPLREKKSAMTELFGGMFMTHHHEPSPKSVAKMAEEEMKLFTAVASIPLDADPLKWWKTHEHLYPHFAMLAQRYLAVPGTSVSREGVFHCWGHCHIKQICAVHKKCGHSSF